ncbi:carbon monoxide dehydrogenase [Thiohalocapsa halophila]|uniref:carbon monoxide dehydrogenase n=1 Tax=Thiohalocapsa halophila TaxID=69359 RepID=UPI001904A32E|nr:carbon monoxide dehydrogenase [Thiohalocapsa halophila]
MSEGRQRQRHGVAKNLAEGIGGLVVGAALVVLARSLLRERRRGGATTDALPRAADPTASATPGSAPQLDPKD